MQLFYNVFHRWTLTKLKVEYLRKYFLQRSALTGNNFRKANLFEKVISVYELDLLTQPNQKEQEKEILNTKDNKWAMILHKYFTPT